MKRLLSLLGFVVAAIVVTFAVSNRESVTLDLFPLPWQIAAPVFLILLGSLAIGILFGLLLAWLAGGEKRKLARQLRRANERQAQEIRDLRTQRDDARRAAGGTLALAGRVPPPGSTQTVPLPPARSAASGAHPLSTEATGIAAGAARR